MVKVLFFSFIIAVTNLALDLKPIIKETICKSLRECFAIKLMGQGKKTALRQAISISPLYLCCTSSPHDCVLQHLHRARQLHTVREGLTSYLQHLCHVHMFSLISFMVCNVYFCEVMNEEDHARGLNCWIP